MTDIPEPRGCPTPGACSAAETIAALRETVARLGELPKPRRFRDEIDAAIRIEEWLVLIVAKLPDAPHRRIDRLGFRLATGGQPSGGTVVVWCDNNVVGIANVVRDDFNHSVLTISEYLPVEEPRT